MWLGCINKLSLVYWIGFQFAPNSDEVYSSIMKLKTLLTTLSFVLVFSQSVFAVESEDAKIVQNVFKNLKAN